MVNILVVTHKEFDDSFLPEEGYKVIKVGNRLTNEICHKKGYLTDDIGTEISDRNPFYCELTGIYWAWKNISPEIDIIGFTHYRRFFVDYSMGGGGDVSNNLVQVNKIDELLKSHSVILPYESIKPKEMFRPTEILPLIEQDIYMGIIEKLLLDNSPEMLPVWKRLTRGNIMIWKNMFITHRKLFNEYCEWVFDILEKFDVEFNKTGLEKLPRIDGYLGEYLTPTFFLTKVPDDQVIHLEICDPNENAKGIKQFMKRNPILMKIARFFLESLKSHQKEH